MIKKHTVQSCCGKKSYVFFTEKAVRKTHLESFRKAGYATPPHYTKSGIFYVVKPGFEANCSFGSTKIQVKAAGQNANQLLDQFENIIDELTKK